MTAIPQPQLDALSDLVGRWTGLYFPAERHAELERGLVRAAKDFGHSSTTSFVNFRLATPQLTPDQVQALAWHLTIGETYFLRGRQTFEVLEREVLPEFLLARKIDERQLRLWSAGCAGGEEPYSLSLLWHARLAQRFAGLGLRVLATDIDAAQLARAERGCYRASSLKELPSELRAQAFERSGELFCVSDALRGRVEFLRRDLRAEPPERSFDVVLCRNIVLTYFEPELRAEVMQRIIERLRPGGALVVGLHEILPVRLAALAPWPEVRAIWRAA